MKRVKAQFIVLGLFVSSVGLVVLGSYVTSNLIPIQAHRRSPNQRPHTFGSSSLAIIANTPTPTSVYTRISTAAETNKKANDLVSVPSMDALPAQQGANNNELHGEVETAPMLMPTSIVTVAALTSTADEDAIVVLLPTATPTVVEAVSPLVPPPTPTAEIAQSAQETGNTVIHEPATEVVVERVALPTATPALPASQALAAAAPPAPDAESGSVPVLAPGGPPSADDVAAGNTASLTADGQAAFVDGCQITSPPDSLGLDPFYHKYCSALGLPIVASAEVPDLALQHAWRTVVIMLDGIVQAEEIRNTMTSMTTRIAIIGVHQVPTDMPEYHDLYTLFPDVDWNNRTRGIGATHQIPLLAIGEENVLCYANDLWVGQNLLVHEFAHAIKNMGIDVVNPSFHSELDRVYRNALDSGLWVGTYAASNVEEYWAEGVRIYFRLEGEPNAPGGQPYPASTRAELQRYDSELYRLIENIFGPREAIVRCS